MDYDLGMLEIISRRWDVELNTRDLREAAQRLADTLRTPARVQEQWARLDDDARQTLQTIAGSNGGRMQAAMFKRIHGEVRIMGPDRRDREQPHLHPISPAETLYYKGLIAFGSDKEKGKSDTVGYVFVPSDLLLLLPTQKTSYDASAPIPTPATAISTFQPENPRLADTSIVDDLTTFLAFCQTHQVNLTETGALSAEQQAEIKPFWLGNVTGARTALVAAMCFDLGIAGNKDSFRPLPTAGEFLKQKRPEQVKRLTETWLQSANFHELWFMPGLRVDSAAGVPDDPILARQSVMNLLEMVASDVWWSVDEFIAEVKDIEPDFMRPNGDYTTLYIQDANTGKYLKGFESWDRVDGAILRFILVGVMHTLGLMDTAEGGKYCRFTAYGRALLRITEWPAGKDEPAITVQPDGVIMIPRAANRHDRFQIARFTEWTPVGDVRDMFYYRLSAAGFAQASRQEIPVERMLRFLKTTVPTELPAPVVTLLESRGAAAGQALTIGLLMVLRTPTPELLAQLENNPNIRRYLGAKLGATAIVVRRDQVGGLADALVLAGLEVQVEVEE